MGFWQKVSLTNFVSEVCYGRKHIDIFLPGSFSLISEYFPDDKIFDMLFNGKNLSFCLFKDSHLTDITQLYTQLLRYKMGTRRERVGCLAPIQRAAPDTRETCSIATVTSVTVVGGEWNIWMRVTWEGGSLSPLNRLRPALASCSELCLLCPRVTGHPWRHSPWAWWSACWPSPPRTPARGTPPSRTPESDRSYPRAEREPPCN